MKSVKILAIGDTILRTRNGEDPFQYVSSFFYMYDFIIINLETTILIREKKYIQIQEKSVLLTTYQDTLNWLSKYKSKIIFTLANNHIMDYGNEGYNDTINFLQKNEFKFCPIDKYLDFDFKNTPFRIYSLFQGIQNNFQKKIMSPNYKFDNERINILSLHWGAAHLISPSLKQIDKAKSFLENGIDIILGCHTHTPETVISYEGKICSFSLGNFNMTNFSTPLKNINRISYMLEVIIENRSMFSFKQIPVIINKNIQPVVDLSVKEYLEQINNLVDLNMSKINRLKYQVSYHLHFSGNFIIKNFLGGWLPRIKKYGFKHFILFLKAMMTIRYIKSLILLPFSNLSKMTKTVSKINSIRLKK